MFDSSNTFEYISQKKLLLQRLVKKPRQATKHYRINKKPRQATKHYRINPAFDFLTAPFHPNETGSMEFLDMVRHCRRDDLEIPPQISYTGADTGFSIKAANGSGHATGSEVQEHTKPIGVRQSLENIGKVLKP
jgi:hypothetical protein